MAVIIGSARIDEKGNITGGAKGDQKQKATDKNDYSGEVAMQEFYVAKKGWYIVRAKDDKVANKIAESMKTACNNANIGYNQADRYGVVKNGTATKVKTNADCSSLVRTCVKEGCGKDPGDFNTETEVATLQKLGIFEPTIEYKNGTTLYTGDILVTKKKGHTVIVVDGTKRGGSSAPTPAKKNPYGEPAIIIKQGCVGDGARWVQWELNEEGAGLTIDGQIGPKSVAAIKNYQKKYNLVVDGEVGPKTRAVMKKNH